MSVLGPRSDLFFGASWQDRNKFDAMSVYKIFIGSLLASPLCKLPIGGFLARSASEISAQAL